MKKLLSMIIALMLVLCTFAMGAVAEEPTTLTLWHRWGGNNEARLTEVVNMFMEAHPEIKVEITAKAGENYELLQSMIADAAAGNDLPDVFLAGYALIEYLATELSPTAMEDLAPTEEALKDVYDRYREGVLGAAQFEGRQIGLPYALSNMVMFVNMDIWEAAGMTEADIPTTWEDMTLKLQNVKDKTDKQGICLATNDHFIDINLSMNAGGHVVSEDGKQVNFTSDEVKYYMTWWQDLHNKGLAPTCNYTEMNTMFYAGDLAIYVGTIMNESSVTEYCDFNWKAFPFPVFEGKEKRMPTGGSALTSFCTNEEEKDEVWTLMSFMLSDEALRVWSKTGYLCPTDIEVEATENQKIAYEQLNDICTDYLYWPGGNIGFEIDSLWANARNSILWQNLDVEETLADLADECNALLDAR